MLSIDLCNVIYMAVTIRNWQDLWDKTLKRSSVNNRKNDLSEIDWLNFLSEFYFKKFGSKFGQADPSKADELAAELNRLKRFVDRGATVLEVGAGTGRLAIPLAKEAKKVTVIEPARASMKLLKENAASKNIANMDFIECLWGDFEPLEKYDLVYSAWSVGASDPASLMKMHEASKGYCALELTASPFWESDFYSQIYPLAFGEEYRSGGSYLNILTTLYEHGIYANLQTWGFERQTRYESVEEALIHWKAVLIFYGDVTQEAEERLRMFYQSRMNTNGTYAYPLKGFDCMIWWKV